MLILTIDEKKSIPLSLSLPVHWFLPFDPDAFCTLHKEPQECGSDFLVSLVSLLHLGAHAHRVDGPLDQDTLGGVAADEEWLKEKLRVGLGLDLELGLSLHPLAREHLSA